MRLCLSDELIKFMEVVKKLDYNEKPDYQKLRKILQQGLKSIGATDDDKLDFSDFVAVAGPSSARVRQVARMSEAILFKRKCYGLVHLRTPQLYQMF